MVSHSSQSMIMNCNSTIVLRGMRSMPNILESGDLEKEIPNIAGTTIPLNEPVSILDDESKLIDQLKEAKNSWQLVLTSKNERKI